MEELKNRLLRFKSIRQAARTLTGTSLEIITEVACKIFDQPKQLVLSRLRTEPVVIVRQAVFYVAHKSGASYSEIGRRMKLDHGTVMHGVKACENRMLDKDYAAQVRALEAACEGTL